MIGFLKGLYKTVREFLQEKRFERATKKFCKRDNAKRTQLDLWQELIETDFRGGNFVEFYDDYTPRRSFILHGIELNKDGSAEIVPCLHESRYHLPKNVKIVKEEGTTRANKTFSLTIDSYSPVRRYAVAQLVVRDTMHSRLERRAKSNQ
jgi:hypothetical protein